MTLDENLRAALIGGKFNGGIGGGGLDKKLSTVSSILNESIPFIPAMKAYQNESTVLKSKYIYIKPAATSGGQQKLSNSCTNVNILSNNNGAATKFTLNGNNSNNFNFNKFGQLGNQKILSQNGEFHGTEPSTSNGYYSNDVKSNGPQVPPPQFVIYPLDAVRLTWDPQLRHGTGVGLSNLGNTCFLNSVLQVLSNTPPLVNYLFSDDHNNSGLNCPAKTGFCAVCSLKVHVKRVYLAAKTRQESVAPSYIVQRLRCVMKNHAYGRQEDAHEFLRYYVDSMQSATLYTFKDRKLDLFTKETSAISRIFGGFHKNDITCLYCNQVSTTFDPFLDISLEIKQFSNIENAFQYFTRVETLSSDNAYKCPKCNKKVAARKSYTIHVPPNVLTVQLKRFDHFGKIDKLVSFPEKLNLRPYMSQKQGMPINYKLYGAVVHSGRSTNSGHYFAFVRNPLDQWHLMDDSRVCVVNARSVLQSSAYLLFYVRIPLQMMAVKPQPQLQQQSAVPIKPTAEQPSILPLPAPVSNLPEKTGFNRLSPAKPSPLPSPATAPVQILGSPPIHPVAPLSFVPRSVQPKVTALAPPALSQVNNDCTNDNPAINGTVPANQTTATATVIRSQEATPAVPAPKQEKAIVIKFLNQTLTMKKAEKEKQKDEKLSNGIETGSSPEKPVPNPIATPDTLTKNSPEKTSNVVSPEKRISVEKPVISGSSDHVTDEKRENSAKNERKTPEKDEKSLKNVEKSENTVEKPEKSAEKRLHSSSRDDHASKKRSHVTSHSRKSRDNDDDREKLRRRNKKKRPISPPTSKERCSPSNEAPPSKKSRLSPENDKEVVEKTADSSANLHKKKHKLRNRSYKRGCHDLSSSPMHHEKHSSRNNKKKSKKKKRKLDQDQSELFDSHDVKRSPERDKGVRHSSEQDRSVRRSSEHDRSRKNSPEERNRSIKQHSPDRNKSVKRSPEHDKRGVKHSPEHSSGHRRHHHLSRKDQRRQKKKLKNGEKSAEKLEKSAEILKKSAEIAKNGGNFLEKVAKSVVLTPLEFLKKYCAPVKTWEPNGDKRQQQTGSNDIPTNLHNGGASGNYANFSESLNGDDNNDRDHYNDELDSGKIKKAKNRNNKNYRYNNNRSGRNLFQKAQDFKNHNS